MTKILDVLLNNIVKLWRYLNLLHIRPLKTFPKLSCWKVSIIPLPLSSPFFQTVVAVQTVPQSGVTARLRQLTSPLRTKRRSHQTLNLRRSCWHICLIWVSHYLLIPLPSQMNSVWVCASEFHIFYYKGFHHLDCIILSTLISDFFDSGLVWIDCEPWMHPESAAQILCSGAHRGPAAQLSLSYNIFLHHFLYSCRSSGPYKTVGYDWIWGWSSKDWSQEESRRPNPQQKNCRLLTFIAELCFSSTLVHDLPDTSFLLTAGRAVGIRDWGWEEGQE